jgi:hypothetical protein
MVKPPRARSEPPAATKIAARRPQKKASGAASEQSTDTAATIGDPSPPYIEAERRRLQVAATAPRKHDVNLGTTTKQSASATAAAEGKFHAIADVLQPSDMLTATVDVGFPAEVQHFRDEINRLAYEMVGYLEGRAEELRHAESDLRSELRRGNKANLIRSYGYDRSTFPTVADATARLNGESRALLEQVSLDRPTPWTLKLIHQRLKETRGLLLAIAAVLGGFAVVLLALTNILDRLDALFHALTQLLHSLGGQ